MLDELDRRKAFESGLNKLQIAEHRCRTKREQMGLGKVTYQEYKLYCKGVHEAFALTEAETFAVDEHYKEMQYRKIRNEGITGRRKRK